MGKPSRALSYSKIQDCPPTWFCPAVTNPPVLDFKSASLYALRLVLHSADTPSLLQGLTARLDAAGDFFQDEPVVIDGGELEQAPDWQALAQLLHQRGLALVGVHVPETLRASVSSAGLACINLGPSRDTGSAGSVHRDPDDLTLDSARAGVALHTASGTAAPSPNMQSPAQAPAEPTASSPQADHAAQAASALPRPSAAIPPEPPRPTLILDRSLRSGQKVYARQADLVVVGMVSPGAEVIADGSIHVYGPLRGKAMAGARGDESARIFTTQLDAELVAVAGVYRVIETQLPSEIHQRPATIRLHEGQLEILSLPV